MSFVSRALLRLRLQLPSCAACVILGVSAPAVLAAQTATVRVEENLRAEPNEVVLGVLRPGAELPVVDRRPGWVQVELQGWMWIRSLQIVNRDGFDLVVVPEDSEADGENLRSRPAGPVLVRLTQGTLLHEVERIPGWVQVRRRAWVWSASVDIDESARPPAPTKPPAETLSRPQLPAAAAFTAGPRGAPVLASPDGDTLATVVAGTDLAVVGRQGSWARVRMDGWVWMPDTTTVVAPEGSTTEAATPAAVMADPAAWRGRIVTWQLQFISLEHAEAVRTDFYEGEPFLLTRPAGSEDAASYVYVALPPEREDELSALRPLETVTVVGRVRVGASVLTGSPILDLMELRRGRGR